jgi:hypothetical protein
MAVFKYFQRIFLALSILLNAFLAGKSNQTFSARNYDWKLRGLPNLVWLIDAVLFFDPDHCKKAWLFWDTIKQHYITR